MRLTTPNGYPNFTHSVYMYNTDFSSHYFQVGLACWKKVPAYACIEQDTEFDKGN